MLGRDKRASLSSSLLAGRESARASEDDQGPAHRPAPQGVRAPQKAPEPPPAPSQVEIARSVIRELRGQARSEQQRDAIEDEAERQDSAAAESEPRAEAVNERQRHDDVIDEPHEIEDVHEPYEPGPSLDASGDAGALAPEGAAAAGQAAIPESAAPEAAEHAGVPPESVLASKGDASASGFRPWYWSYERDGSPPPSDSAGSVTPFPTSAPAPASPPGPVSAPATSGAPRRPGLREATAAAPLVSPRRFSTATTQPHPRPPRPLAPRRSSRTVMLVIGGLSAVALLASATFFYLSQSPEPREEPRAVAAAKPTPALPAPKPAESTRPEPRPAPAAPATAAAHPPAATEVAEFMTRGDQLLATGDIAAARMFYERAAEGGSAAAATAAGKTYDPIFLAEVHARGIRGDPVMAAQWYRKASAGGDRQADTLMKRLMAKYAGG